MVLLVVVGVIVFVRHREHGSSPKTDVKHHGAGSIVSKGPHSSTPAKPVVTNDRGTLRLEGQVIDEEQRPVAGAQVFLIQTESTTTTAEDGTFSFENLAPRRYRLLASKDEFYAPMASVRLSDASEPVILRMRRGATFIVHVTSESGPVAGARLTMDSSVKAVSGADGVARIGGVGPHFHYVEVSADGFAPDAISIILGDDPGGTIEQSIVLRHGAALSGSVVGPDGKLVPNASVDIEQLGSPEDRWHGRAKANASGEWKFDVLSAGKYSLRASSDVYGPSRPVVVELDGSSPKSGVALRAEYDAQLVGSVVGVDGKPVADCVIYAETPTQNHYSERTDASGHFALLGILAGDYDVFCVKDRLSSPPVRVSIANDERVEIRLVVDEGSIAGVVLDSTGTPVAEANVSAMPTDGFSIGGFGDDTTDSHGRFDLGGLPPGEYLVSATWPDQEDLRVGKGDRISTGNRNVKVVLPAQATIKGRALLDGKTLPYYGLLVTETPEYSFMGYARGVRSPDGTFAVRGVTPGTWGVVLIAPGTARKIISGLHVEAGKVTDIGDIAMEHGQRISGRVLDSNGTPVPGARVSVGRSSMLNQTEMQHWFGGEFETVSDRSGAYHFDGVAPLGGRRPPNIAAAHPLFGASVPAPLPSGDAVVDLVLAPTGAIDGVVEGPSGGIALVSAKRVADPSARVTANVDSTGKFVFPALPPGEYSVTLAALPGQVGISTTVTVVAKQRVSARIVTGAKRVALIVKVAGAGCKGVVLKLDTGSASSSDTGIKQCSRGIAKFEVAPGSYQACPDGEGCVPVVIAATPATQTVEIPSAPQ